MTLENRLIYLPLGGAGEIGMNAYVYGYGPAGKERLILVDLGVTFPDMETTPGVDLILPDITWLEERADQLEAIFITHAHEDHIGALGHLWPKLRAPVYARYFTSLIAKYKLDELGISSHETVMHVAPAWPEKVKVGPFDVAFMPVSHSIPGSSALVIDTPAGRIFHTGDFKIDPDPVVGEGWSDTRIEQMVVERPVKALVCDSTNVYVTHPGRSEAVLKEPLTELMQKRSAGMVAATTFGSNIARLKTLAEAAHAAGRSICVLGRSMRRMLRVAEEAGVVQNFPPLISPEQAVELSRSDLFLLVTGSQGEHRAASAQLSRGKFLGLEMKAGDLFLFSSKTIPGNERAVLRVVNALSEKGIDIMDDCNGRYHVSGHANRPDLEHLHRLILPDMVIPMHGEYRHLREHSCLSIDSGIMSQIAPDGTMLDLTGEEPRVSDRIDLSRLYLDGSVLLGAFDGVVRDRIRLARNGHVTITLILDEEHESLGDVWVDLSGLPERGKARKSLLEMIETELTEFVENANSKLRGDDARLEEALRRLLRQITIEEIGKKPEVDVVISRLQSG